MVEDRDYHQMKRERERERELGGRAEPVRPPGGEVIQGIKNDSRTMGRRSFSYFVFFCEGKKGGSNAVVGW